MNRLASSILCAVVASAAVWLVLRTAAEPPLPTVVEPGLDDMLAVHAPVDSAAADLDPDLDADDLAAEFDREDFDREDLGDAVEMSPTGPILTVVDAGRAHAPVADAEVFFVEREAARVAAGDQPFTHMAVLAVRHGTRLTSGADGRVQLPPIRSPVAVAARSGRLFGFRLVGPRHAPHEQLALIPDETLRLAVVDDATGAGVSGVPVGVFERDGRRMRQRQRVETDAAGTAVLEHFQLHRGSAHGTHAEFVAAVLLPFVEPVDVTFRDNPLPDHELVLRMPTTGSVAVHVVDPSGAGFPNAGEMRLRVLDRPRSGWSALGAAYDAQHLAKHVGQETVIFERVGLDLTLQIGVELVDDDFEWRVDRVAGPTASGQVVEVELATPTWMGLLCGRLVDPDGAAVRGVAPTFLVTDRAGRLEGEQLPLESDGRFRLPFRIRSPEPPFALEIRHESEEGVLADVRVPLPGLEVGRRTELGDIVLAPAARLAFGRVVDDRGAPIEGARVELQVWRELGGDPPRSQWRDEAFVDASTDDEGEYAVDGGASHGGRSRLRFTARATSRSRRPRSCAVNASTSCSSGPRRSVAPLSRPQGWLAAR